MSFTSLAGVGGIGFELVAITINVIYIRAGLPLPVSGQSLDAVTDAFAAKSLALKRPSVVGPACSSKVSALRSRIGLKCAKLSPGAK